MHVGRWSKLIATFFTLIALLQIVTIVYVYQFSNTPPSSISSNLVSSFSLQNESDEVLMLSHLKYSYSLDASGEYRIACNVGGIKSPSSFYDVTLITQASLHNLHFLIQLADLWEGPISLAVLAVEDQTEVLVKILSALRRCHTSIANNVTFHVVVPLHANKKSDMKNKMKASFISCENLSKKIKSMKTNENYKYKFFPYPTNLLRNVARHSVGTEFVFVIDVDVLPSPKLRSNFLNYAFNKRKFKEAWANDRNIYTLPVYETAENIYPISKQKLLEYIQGKKIRPFYSEICWNCQNYTDFERWQKAPGDEVSVLYEVLWKEPWEPFYIARNSVPLYDERFRQYGYNRISQMCELYVAGYNFFVLNNAWLLHLGLKLVTSFHPEKETENQRNELLYQVFKEELKHKYPESNRTC